MFCTCLCLLGSIRWCSVPKLSLASAASAANGSTHLFAESHRGARAADPAGPGELPHQWVSVCAAQRLLQQGGSGSPSSMTAPGASLGLIFGGLWGNSVANRHPQARQVNFQKLFHNISLQWHVQNQISELSFL